MKQFELITHRLHIGGHRDQCHVILGKTQQPQTGSFHSRAFGRAEETPASSTGKQTGKRVVLVTHSLKGFISDLKDVRFTVVVPCAIFHTVSIHAKNCPT